MSETPTQTLAKLLEESNAQVVFDQKTVRAIVAEKDARIAELEAVIESDRSKLADAVTQIHKVLDGKFWLTEGRGSYTWDDDRYRQEFHDAAVDLLAAIKSIEKLAADLSNSPKTSDAVHAARIDKDKRIAELEKENAKLYAEIRKDHEENEKIIAGLEAALAEIAKSPTVAHARWCARRALGQS